MPYKMQTDKLLIPKQLKRSAKLSDGDKEEIRYRYLKVGGVSQRELAREYGVSRRLIVFCIYPERQKENYANRVAKGGSKQYYDKEKNTTAQREHRRYKKTLYDEDKLKQRNDDET